MLKIDYKKYNNKEELELFVIAGNGIEKFMPEGKGKELVGHIDKIISHLDECYEMIDCLSKDEKASVLTRLKFINVISNNMIDKYNETPEEMLERLISVLGTQTEEE